MMLRTLTWPIHWFTLGRGGGGVTRHLRGTIHPSFCEQVPSYPGQCQTGAAAHHDEVLKELIVDAELYG